MNGEEQFINIIQHFGGKCCISGLPVIKGNVCRNGMDRIPDDQAYTIGKFLYMYLGCNKGKKLYSTRKRQ